MTPVGLPWARLRFLALSVLLPLAALGATSATAQINPPPDAAPGVSASGRSTADCQFLGDAAERVRCLDSVRPGLGSRGFDPMTGRPLPQSGPAEINPPPR